jgi:26S proteasome regulatory subunit N1
LIQRVLADILSVLAMTMPGSDGLSLKYKLSGTREALDLWGHEYVRNLTAEIRDEYNRRMDAKEDVSELLAVVAEIAPFHMQHHAEPDAVDLLLEIEQLDQLVPLADDRNYKRVCFRCCTPFG